MINILTLETHHLLALAVIGTLIICQVLFSIQKILSRRRYTVTDLLWVNGSEVCERFKRVDEKITYLATSFDIPTQVQWCETSGFLLIRFLYNNDNEPSGRFVCYQGIGIRFSRRSRRVQEVIANQDSLTLNDICILMRLCREQCHGNKKKQVRHTHYRLVCHLLAEYYCIRSTPVYRKPLLSTHKLLLDERLREAVLA